LRTTGVPQEAVRIRIGPPMPLQVLWTI